MVINMMFGAHVIVSGRVQGVYFRGNTRNEARKYRVTDWVRNLLYDGVETLFEGEKETVDKAIEFVRYGPSYAKVTDLELGWMDYNGEFADFCIIY